MEIVGLVLAAICAAGAIAFAYMAFVCAEFEADDVQNCFMVVLLCLGASGLFLGLAEHWQLAPIGTVAFATLVFVATWLGRWSTFQTSSVVLVSVGVAAMISPANAWFIIGVMTALICALLADNLLRAPRKPSHA